MLKKRCQPSMFKYRFKVTTTTPHFKFTPCNYYQYYRLSDNKLINQDTV